MALIPTYENKTRFKVALVLLALVVALLSVFYTRTLVDELATRELKQIDLHARALEFIANSEANENISFLFNEIIESNHNIPVILTDADTNIINSRNVVEEDWSGERQDEVMRKELKLMRAEYDPIKVEIAPGFSNYIWYRHSSILNRLKWYPYIQLGIIAILAITGYVVFSYFRTAEQDRIWAGMAKETAHQLGTPISSLMAWIEYLKETGAKPDETILGELDKDVQRLQLVAGRFGQIGSKPDLKPEPADELVREITDYLRPRISNKIELNFENFVEDKQITVNRPLFQWVVENIVKNAVDAIVKTGSINLVAQENESGHFILDIQDTGKGMTPKQQRNVFRPGFTTKRRGWGLGLTLAKRIVEDHHNGKLFVKASEVGKGTTFRIVLMS